MSPCFNPRYLQHRNHRTSLACSPIRLAPHWTTRLLADDRMVRRAAWGTGMIDPSSTTTIPSSSEKPRCTSLMFTS